MAYRFSYLYGTSPNSNQVGSGPEGDAVQFTAPGNHEKLNNHIPSDPLPNAPEDKQKDEQYAPKNTRMTSAEVRLKRQPVVQGTAPVDRPQNSSFASRLFFMRSYTENTLCATKSSTLPFLAVHAEKLDVNPTKQAQDNHVPTTSYHAEDWVVVDRAEACEAGLQKRGPSTSRSVP